MRLPAPTECLRHRPPALLIGRIESWDGRTVRCAGTSTAWSWVQLLEGAAQAAGIGCGLGEDGWRDGAVVADYRDVEILANAYDGGVAFEATLARRILGFRRCRAVARARGGEPLLRAVVTLLPDGPRT